MLYTCPICGYPDLSEPPRARGGGGSYEICPSCGFQFGVSDDDAGHSYEAWRRAWKERGMPWASKSCPPPAGWDPEAQLRKLSARPHRRPG